MRFSVLKTALAENLKPTLLYDRVAGIFKTVYWIAGTRGFR